MFSKTDRYMILKIFVAVENVELRNKYANAIAAHNAKMLSSTEQFVDSGFDVITPQKVGIFSGAVNKVNFEAKFSAKMRVETGKEFNTGYLMYPRSSISKTPLRLANSIGVIDSGYRGNLIGMFDCIYPRKGSLCECDYDYIINQHEKVVQICAPGLVPIIAELVDSESELSVPTSRGEGGFGSTSSVL